MSVSFRRTKSPDFPTVDPIQASMSGEADAFVTVFEADGASLAFSTFLGGIGNDLATSVRLDPDGNIYIQGPASVDFPTTANSLMPNPPAPSGGCFMAKIEAIPFVPGPVLTSLFPPSANAGDAGFMLAATGSDFVDGAVVRWDGSNRSTTFISGSEVDVAIETADLVAGKTVMITVRNPDTGVSNSLPFTINNPAPVLTSISPTSATGGGAAFTLTVEGSGFVPNSVVSWNGRSRTTTYISATELHAAILASDLSTGGDIPVTVLNPAPSGGASSAIVFPVSAYTLSSTPTSVTVTAGQSATYTVNLTPQYGSFDSAVTFSCTGLPNKCAATFSPASLTPGASAASTTLTLPRNPRQDRRRRPCRDRRPFCRRPRAWPCWFLALFWRSGCSRPTDAGSRVAGWRPAHWSAWSS
jgi:hypothetical protein